MKNNNKSAICSFIFWFSSGVSEEFHVHLGEANPF